MRNELTLVLRHIPREQEKIAVKLLIIPAEPFMPLCCVIPELLVFHYTLKSAHHVLLRIISLFNRAFTYNSLEGT